jgi:gentisate 1,2-dioxygenase
MLQRSTIISSETDRQAYYEELKADKIAPAWTSQDTGSAAEPHSRVVPYVWQWQVLRRHALRALELVGTMEAERRVIRCMNPGLARGATNTLVANIQIVGPGEIARAHRHTPAALRMIIESTGGYTVVNGETVPMLPGDLVLTPNWTWHDHANDSETPIIWLDGLDSPLINMLEARFQEEYPQERQRASEDVDLSFTKYGAGSLRPAWESPTRDYSPQLRYPWTQTQDALDRLAATEVGSPHDGVIMEYSNPLTGGPVMPTIACFAQVLRAGRRTKPHRHTSSTVYHVIEGHGSTIVEGVRLDWGPKDVFTIPNWAWHEHVNESAAQPAYLFSFTDEPVYRALQLFREEPALN